MKKFIAFVLLVSFASIFSECKKYSEDKFLAFRTVHQRFHAGQWSIVKVLYDGNDITASYTDSLQGRNITDIDLKFEKQKPKLEGVKYSSSPSVYFNFNQKKPDQDNYQIGRGYYGVSAINNKKDVGFGFNSDPKIKDTLCFRVMERLFYNTWEIRNLYGDKMHLRHGISIGNPYNYVEVFFERN